jgi:integrase
VGGAMLDLSSLEGKVFRVLTSILSRAFEKACKRSGITGLRFHDLRHTAATRMIERGVNIAAVSRLLGHADIKTTMRYSHPNNSLKEAVESLNDGFSELRYTTPH